MFVVHETLPNIKKTKKIMPSLPIKYPPLSYGSGFLLKYILL
jgi:hypothetical protein